MEEIAFKCPKCVTDIRVQSDLSGGKVSCPVCDSTLLVPMPGIKPGMKIAGFVVERPLGIGGSGEVWLAEQTAMDRKVALKILSPGLTQDPDFVSRFNSEIQLIGKLNHPNIVTAYDAGQDNGIYYLAVCYIDGLSVEQKLEKETIIDELESLRIIRTIALALSYAWRNFKILHCDIKPANVMLDQDGVAHLTDLGISRTIAEDSKMTSNGVIFGTPHYMSPEQTSSAGELDQRSDIYSLGTTLYNMLTGQVPFDSEDPMEILSKHVNEEFPNPLNINPEISDQCSVLLEKMMSKEKDERQGTWEEVVSDIDQVMAGQFPGIELPNTEQENNDSNLKTTTGIEPVKDSEEAKGSGSDIPPTQVPPSEKIESTKSVPIKIARPEPTPVLNTEKTEEDLDLPDKLFDASKPEEEKPKGKTFKLVVGLSILMISTLIILGVVGIQFLKYYYECQEIATRKALLEKEIKEKERLKAEFEKKKAEASAQAEQKKKDSLVLKRKKRQGMWNYASSFGKKALLGKNNPWQAIKNFEKIKKAYPNSKSAMMAEAEIAKLKNFTFKLKKKRIAKVLNDLNKKSEPLLKKKRFWQIAKIYKEYNGPSAEETKTIRIRISKKYENKAKTQNMERQRRIAEQYQKRIKYLSSLVPLLIKGKHNNAIDKIDQDKQTKAVPKIRKLFYDIKEVKNKLRIDLTTDIGATVVLQTRKKTYRGEMKRIEGECIFLEEKVGKVGLIRKISINSISVKSVVKRLPKKDEIAVQIFLALRAYQQKDLKCADQYLKTSANKIRKLFPPLAEKLDSFYKKNLNNLAEIELVDIFRKLGARMKRWDTTEANTQLIMLKGRANERQTAKAQEKLIKYCAKFSKTDFVNKNINILKSLADYLQVDLAM